MALLIVTMGAFTLDLYLISGSDPEQEIKLAV